MTEPSFVGRECPDCRKPHLTTLTDGSSVCESCGRVENDPMYGTTGDVEPIGAIRAAQAWARTITHSPAPNAVGMAGIADTLEELATIAEKQREELRQRDEVIRQGQIRFSVLRSLNAGAPVERTRYQRCAEAYLMLGGFVLTTIGAVVSIKYVFELLT